MTNKPKPIIIKHAARCLNCGWTIVNGVCAPSCTPQQRKPEAFETFMQAWAKRLDTTPQDDVLLRGETINELIDTVDGVTRRHERTEEK